MSKSFVICVSVVVLWLLFTFFLYSANKNLKAELAQANIVIAGQASLIVSLQDDLDVYNQIFSVWSEEREIIARQNTDQRQQVEQIKQNSPEFKVWADTALPVELKPGGSLREARNSRAATD